MIKVDDWTGVDTGGGGGGGGTTGAVRLLGGGSGGGNVGGWMADPLELKPSSCGLKLKFTNAKFMGLILIPLFVLLDGSLFGFKYSI